MARICRKYRNWLIAMQLLFIIAVIPVSAVGQVVIIVHPKSEITDISLEELKHIYLGKTTAFANGESVYLMENSALTKKFCKMALDMTVSKFRKHWMKIVFSGEYAQPPDPYKNNEDVLEAVVRNEGAICFIDSEAVTDDAKIISVDGLMPDDDGYLFSDPIPDKEARGVK